MLKSKAMERHLLILPTVFTIFAGNLVGGSHVSALGETYTHHVVLSENAYEVYWKYDSENIVFEVEVATTGWVGFGLSPNGGMAGADIVIGGVNSDGSKYFTDRHATQNGAPSIDNEQNYELLHASQSEGKTTLRFKRKLDTCDDDDMIVNGDTFRVIWSYGDNDAVNYHGPSATRRGTKSVLLLGWTRPKPEMPADTFTWDFLVDNVKVPGRDTTYWCKGFNVPSLEQKHHVLKYEPVVTKGNEAVVHHIVIYACYGDVNTTGAHLLDAEDCGLMPNNLQQSCLSILFVWAVGGETFYFPENTGLPFGDAEQPKFLLLEIHYDNPALATNVVDSSGIKLTLSPTLRQYDSTVLTMGHGVYRSQAVPPNTESFTTYGYCNKDCTREGFAHDGVKLYAGMLHSHLRGRKMRLRHIRNGVEQEPLFEDNNYDFNYQEMVIRRSERVVLPEDELQLECGLSSTDKNTFTYGGLATTDEMCVAFLLYYPRANLTTCYSTPGNFGAFWDAKGLSYTSNERGRLTVEIAPNVLMGEREALENMTWTSENAALLETSMRNSNYMAWCADGERNLDTVNRPYGTYSNGINITSHYQPPARRCQGPTTRQPSPTQGDPNYAVSVHRSGLQILALLLLASIL